MASLTYEEEQRRLQRMFDEVETDVDVAEDSDSSLGEDNIEIQEENSDSEQDITDNELNGSGSCEQRRGTRIPCMMGKDGTKWRKHCHRYPNVRTRRHNIVTQLPGVKGEAKNKKTPIEIWSLFITDTMLQNIVLYTNKYIVAKNYSETYRTARTTDIDELKAFLGLLYLGGVMKSNFQNAADLFRSDGMGLEMFRLTMSLERFKFLLRNIRLDDKETRPARQEYDKLAPIREFFEDFNNNLPKFFSLSQYATIDEMLWAFRGRCGFRVYIPSKPNKYGLKVYALVDAKMFYTAKMEIYVGQQPKGPFYVNTSNMFLVSRLCQPISGSNRNLTTDNFFSSIPLAYTLLQEHKLTLIGTLRKNKPQIPPDMMIKRPEKTTMFAFEEKSTLVSYIPQPRKNVFLLSTMHLDDSIDGETGKPSIIIDYNKTKGGVDMVDKLCAAYNCARITRRWPLVLFYGLLNIAGINSYIIYKNNNIDKNIPRKIFLEILAKQLVENHTKKRFNCNTVPRTSRLRIQEIYNISTTENVQNQPPTHGRCHYCSSKKSRKTRFSCYKCKKFMCLEHLSAICKECVDI